jgi:hypothetical protein
MGHSRRGIYPDQSIKYYHVYLPATVITHTERCVLGMDGPTACDYLECISDHMEEGLAPLQGHGLISAGGEHSQLGAGIELHGAPADQRDMLARPD